MKDIKKRKYIAPQMEVQKIDHEISLIMYTGDEVPTLPPLPSSASTTETTLNSSSFNENSFLE